MTEFDSIEWWTTAITSYLAEHPNASDTAEGIARWWLGADYADWWKVKLALDWMVRRGVLARHMAADGRESYRNAPR